MRYEYIKSILFWSLINTAPGLIFLIQVVMIMPANMMFAYVLSALFETPNEWGLMLLFTGYFLVIVAIWAIFAVLIAKLVCLVRNSTTRSVLLFFIIIAIFYLAFLPVYGSGGHGPMRWVTAVDLNEAGIQYWLHVFPLTLLLALWHLWFLRRRLQ